MADFDTLCEGYEERLDKDLKIFGEKHKYFSEFKVLWIKQFLSSKKIGSSLKILEVGCGIGSLNKYFCLNFPQATYYGIDVSLHSIKKAKQSNKDFNASYYCGYDGRNIPFKDGSFDIVILAGLLHHILPKDRLQILNRIYQVLDDKGFVFIFEHNIYNPIVRYIVKNCIIDQNANLLALNTSISYLPKCKFKAVKANYIIFFPRFLKKLRFLERLLFWFPLGAQYALVIMKTSLANKCKKSK